MRLHQKSLYGIFLLLPLGCAAQEVAKYPLPKLGDSLTGRSWTVADFDGDGKLDLLTSFPVRSASGTYLHDLFLRFDSNAETHLRVVSDSGRINLTAWDVDGDKDLDVLVTSTISNRLLSVWINDGNGNFTLGEAGSWPDTGAALGRDGISDTASPMPPLLLQARERIGDGLPGTRTSFFLPMKTAVASWSSSDRQDTTTICRRAGRAPPSVL